MTKTLDDFAIAAMQGLLSNDVTGFATAVELAELSYNIAEAMMKESRKRREEKEHRYNVETGEIK